MSFTTHDLTVDFRGARIQGSLKGAHGIFRLQTSTDVVVNDAKVFGTGYVWDSATQHEHGIQIDGGSDITLNNPTTRDTRGDGIYVGYQVGKNSPASGVVIIDPDIKRAARNGITPVAGEATIRGGHIDRVGLHGVNFEPSIVTAAASIRGVVNGIDIRRHGDLGAFRKSSYAIAAAGNVRGVAQQPTKRYMRIENVSGDCLRMTVRSTARVIVRNNISDVATGASFPRSGLIDFTGNVRITGTLRPTEPCPQRDSVEATPPGGTSPGVVPAWDGTLAAHMLLYWVFVTAPKHLEHDALWDDNGLAYGVGLDPPSNGRQGRPGPARSGSGASLPGVGFRPGSTQ